MVHGVCRSDGLHLDRTWDDETSVANGCMRGDVAICCVTPFFVTIRTMVSIVWVNPD